MVSKNKTKHCMTPNGAFFSKDKKGLPMWRTCTMIMSSIKNFFSKIQEFEDTGDPAILKRISQYDNIQMAKKISLNSATVQLVIVTFVITISWSTPVTSSGQLSIHTMD